MASVPLLCGSMSTAPSERSGCSAPSSKAHLPHASARRSVCSAVQGLCKEMRKGLYKGLCKRLCKGLRKGLRQGRLLRSTHVASHAAVAKQHETSAAMASELKTNLEGGDVGRDGDSGRGVVKCKET